MDSRQALNPSVFFIDLFEHPLTIVLCRCIHRNRRSKFEQAFFKNLFGFNYQPETEL